MWAYMIALGLLITDKVNYFEFLILLTCILVSEILAEIIYKFIKKHDINNKELEDIINKNIQNKKNIQKEYLDAIYNFGSTVVQFSITSKKTD